MIAALRKHWPEYLIEAFGLGVFMLAAVLVTALLEHPGSPVRRAMPDPFLRRVLIGVAMGLTAVCIIYSPWGRRSGAHLNPAFTLVFLRLGKIAPADAAWYAIAQFAGGVLGVVVAAAIIGGGVRAPEVSYAVTAPGPAGVATAFVGEAIISALLMAMVLVATNTDRLAPWTGVLAGVLIALYITFEAPYSGMSMNPARTLASALPAMRWDALWLYFVAPPVGMFLAAETYVAVRGARSVLCAKLCHDNSANCIFRCGYCRHAASAVDPEEVRDAR